VGWGDDDVQVPAARGAARAARSRSAIGEGGRRARPMGIRSPPGLNSEEPDHGDLDLGTTSRATILDIWLNCERSLAGRVCASRWPS
jgi:hypothetical protein